MEYAAGGELFDRIVKAGRFSEDEARYFFQQLICGVAWCHREVRAGRMGSRMGEGSGAPGRRHTRVGAGLSPGLGSSCFWF
jgi:hypothetical protein